MSKSLGNFTTIRDLLETFEPMAVRLFILQAHYRKPLDFTPEALQAATNGWHTLQEGLLLGYELGWPVAPVPGSNPWKQRFQDAVDDDFNFSGALAVLFEIAKELRKERNIRIHQGETKMPAKELQEAWQTLLELCGVLGLKREAPLGVEIPAATGTIYVGIEPETASISNTLTDGEIEALIQQRQVARLAKNYQESDRLRDLLQAQGVTLIDMAGGVTKWHRS